MRAPQIRQAKDGTVSYKVRFRLDGAQTSQTFMGDDGETEALEFCHLLDDLGAEAAMAYMARRDAAILSNYITLNRWFGEYLQTLTGVEPRTLTDYQRVYDRHIKPMLGHMPLDAIGKAEVAALINKLAREGKVTTDAKGKTKRVGLAAKSIANVHGILSACLNGAVIERKIEANPCQGIRLPRTGEVESNEERYLSHDEYNRLEAALPQHWVPLVITLVGTGMRWSEATALRVGEVHADASLPTIRIIRATKWVPGEGHHDGVPKTKKSRRTVIMPPQVADALRPLVAGKHAEDYVFTARNGGQVRHSGFHRLVWKPACAKADLIPAPRIHDLRHTFASWMIEYGIGLEAIQDQLGHESILTTRKVYGHLQPAMREALAQAAFLALASGRTPDALPESAPASPAISATAS